VNLLGEVGLLSCSVEEVPPKPEPHNFPEVDLPANSQYVSPMSNFVTFFPSKDCAQPPASFSKLDRIFHGPLRADHVQTGVLNGATILSARSASRAPRFYAQEDGAGWIVVKGQIFDVRAENPAVDLRDLLHHFLTEDSAGLNHYEGTFALAAWDARKRQGWAINDQASMLNLYYGEYDGGLYVSTNAISLARALGLRLDPGGLQELLARKVLLAPTTMFAGLRRVNIGEHIRYRGGTLSRGKHWHWYEPEAKYRNLREAADAAAAVVVDRVARYAASASPVVSDLTGGYDSRLLASAVHAAGLEPAVTVNGPPDHPDVRISYQVAKAMQWDMRHFDTQLLLTAAITPDVQQELLYRTNGELRFTEMYLQRLVWPILGQDFNLHLEGSGGPLLRYMPWSQEFFGIGRQRLANIDNVLNFRLLTDVPPPSLFSQDWLPVLRSRLRSRLQALCREQPGALTTQQCDAIHVWKMTGHGSLYISSGYDWLPGAAPYLSAGVVKTAIALPWTMCLTSRLQRQMIYDLSPRAARVVTAYGGPAEPTSLRNLHLVALQFAKRGTHLVDKLDRILLNGAVTKRLPSSFTKHLYYSSRTIGAGEQAAQGFRELLVPKTMFSRRLYDAEGLREVLSGSDDEWQARSSLITRLETIEALCRELDFEPEADFLASAPPE
jgi:hypothetical protein